MGDYEFVVSDGSGHARVRAFPGRRFVVGAGPECAMRFDEGALCPSHAEVSIDQQEQPWVTDLTGRGLVWVNSEPTLRAMIPEGSKVRLGELELVVRHRADGVPTEARPELVPLVNEVDPLRPGATVDGRYRVIRKLAMGGMGEVYLAEHVELGKLMALKVMRPELSRDPEFAARFRREAIAAGRIGQMNIVDISDFGQTEDGRFYFVMEFLDGHTLATVVREEGAMRVQRAVWVALQIARALASAHGMGIIHRDLKPENVMLLQRPEHPDFVKVLDFGVAKVAAGHGHGGQTLAGTLVGTPQYMAPEQAKALPVDARSDIYSLGLILYELVTGRQTFYGETPSMLLVNQITEPPPPLDPGPIEEVPLELEELVFRMLEKEPARRPQTMEEVVRRLGALGASLKAGVALRPGSASLATPPLTSRVASVSGRHGAPWGPRDSEVGERLPPTQVSGSVRLPGTSRALLVVGLAALTLLAGSGAYVWLDASRPPRVTPQVQQAASPESRAPLPPPLEVKEGPPPMQKVTMHLKSRPSGAEVYEDEAFIGHTPLDVSEAEDREAAFTFVRVRYKTRVARVRFKSEQDLIVDLEKVPSPVKPPRRAPEADDVDPGRDLK